MKKIMLLVSGLVLCSNVMAMHRARAVVECVRARPQLVVGAVGVAMLPVACEVERASVAEQRRRALAREVLIRIQVLESWRAMSIR